MPQKVVDQRVIAVYFDKDRRVRRLANYGLKDGKIFDFVSQTTPTGGKERNLLAQHVQEPQPAHDVLELSSRRPREQQRARVMRGPFSFCVMSCALSAPAPPAAAAPRCW